ncbi:MAG: exodeoxyribonuclease V subunit gamma [Burkholderiaceae bacterium]|nr:exodeoxyribonuclease V subunit gamma [Burkholderiaceae bacterium]
MLTIHFANRLETLEALLTDALAAPGASPFTADEVIVPSAALQRRLTLALAREHGICAQVRFSYLAQWLWQQAALVRSAVSGRPAQARPPLQAEPLAWRIYAAFADDGWVAAHPRLGAYLVQADAVTRLDLAQRLAGLFDQYATYRPDWLARWSAGETAFRALPAVPDEPWQASLWRRLAAELAPAPDVEALIHPLGPLPPDAALPAGAGLPAAAHVFGLPAIPPVHLALLQQLGRWIDLQVYALNPCRQYWFDIVDRRRLARLAHLAARGQAGHHEEGNRLLAAWGRQAQAQLAGLVEACGDAVIDDEHYTPHPAPTRLAALHNAILDLVELAPGSVALRDDDRSLEVHVCHSLTRELEVLQDTLLALRAEPDAPAPGEILVVMPDLEACAPLIDSVFGTAPRERSLPYTITGLAPSRVNAPARALLDALALAGSRAPVGAVFGLLQQPVVARRFGLDDEGLARVHRWLQDGGVHWALDEAHRAALGLPPDARHGLADGLERLYLGYALPGAAAEPFDGLLPAGGAEGSDALALGALWRFAELLADLRIRLAKPLPPAEALALLSGLSASLLQPDAGERADLAELHEAIATLAERWQQAELVQPLPAELLRQALAQVLDDPARGGVPTGRITFSAISSLRGLPYRMVCVLGLDDGAFPTAQRPAEFDLMAAAPRPGDRQRRSDERNLFLDLLLAARDRLHLSYTGRSVRDNAVLPPSVLVAELLDTLLPALAASPQRARDRVVIEHPLQAFDPSLFDPAGDARRRSHQQDYALALAAARAGAAAQAAARAAPAVETPPDDAIQDTLDTTEADDDAGADDDDRAEEGPAPPFFARPLARPPASARRVTLDALQRFFRNPSRHLLQQRLGLSLRRADESLADDEPFLAGFDARQALARRLLPALQAGADDDALHALAAACPELPGGLPGRQFVAAELPLLRRHAQALDALTAAPPLPPQQRLLEFDIDGEPWQLDIALATLRPDGQLRQRYDDARAGDYLATWIAHAGLCACAPVGVEPQTVWTGRDGAFTFLPCDDATAVLQALLRLYAAGQVEPLYFFPRSAWAWLRPGGSLAQARQAWTPTRQRPNGEQSDAAHRLALRGMPNPLGDGLPRFEAAARAVFEPLLRCLDDPRFPAHRPDLDAAR